MLKIKNRGKNNRCKCVFHIPINCRLYYHSHSVLLNLILPTMRFLTILLLVTLSCFSVEALKKRQLQQDHLGNFRRIL